MVDFRDFRRQLLASGQPFKEFLDWFNRTHPDSQVKAGKYRLWVCKERKAGTLHSSAVSSEEPALGSEDRNAVVRILNLPEQFVEKASFGSSPEPLISSDKPSRTISLTLPGGISVSYSTEDPASEIAKISVRLREVFK